MIIPNHSREKLLSATISNAAAAPTTTTGGSSDGNNVSSPKSTVSSSIFEQDHIAAIQDLYGIPVQAVASDDGSWESELAKFGRIESGLQLLTLCMNKETVETWKGFAVQSGELSKCSTFDVLCAHVWKVCNG